MTTENTPTIAKMALGALITRIRERSDKDPKDVAAELGIHIDTYNRWEAGKFAPKGPAIKGLAEAIGATDEERSRMSTLSMESKQRGLFEGNDIPPHLRAFYETEASATLIRSVGLEHLPGLLQTRDCQRLVQEAQLPIEPERAVRLRDVRTRRQQITFSRKPLPRMRFLVGQAALMYLDDYPAMRDEQVARLREVAAMPRVSIRVMTTFHASMLAAFTILTPPHNVGGRPFVYTEGIDGGRYVEDRRVDVFEKTFQYVEERQSVELEDFLR